MLSFQPEPQFQSTTGNAVGSADKAGNRPHPRKPLKVCEYHFSLISIRNDSLAPPNAARANLSASYF
jgi:hypothetical protein